MKDITITLNSDLDQIIRLQELLIEQTKEHGVNMQMLKHLEDILTILKAVEKMDAIVIDETKN